MGKFYGIFPAWRRRQESKDMRVCLLILIGAIAIMETQTWASNWTIQTPYPQNFGAYSNPDEAEPASLWSQFNDAFEWRAPADFNDRFEAYNYHVDDLWGNGNRIRDYDAMAARHALTDSVRSSMRNALLAMDLPGLTWIRNQHDVFSSFLWNSLDNSDEESVSTRDPSYRSVENSWWEGRSQERQLAYGVRPFSTDPYAYMDWRIKRQGRVWLLGDARYHFQNFGDHRFELTLSSPITEHTSLQFGTSYQFGVHPSQRNMVIKFAKTFHSGGVFNVGIETQKRSTLIAAITLPWG